MGTDKIFKLYIVTEYKSKYSITKYQNEEDALTANHLRRMAAAYKELKLEIEYVKKLFPKTHNVFRITSATVDDLTCVFCDKNEKKHTISCNITSMYPCVAPMWFSESEDPCLIEIIE